MSKIHIPSRLWINAYQRGGNLNRWIIHLIKFPPTYLSDICIYSQATRNVSFWQEIKSKLKVEHLGPLPQKLQRECKRSQISWNFSQNSSKFVEMAFLKKNRISWLSDFELMNHWWIIDQSLFHINMSLEMEYYEQSVDDTCMCERERTVLNVSKLSKLKL